MAAPVEELQNFLQGFAPSTMHPNNPLATGAMPSANKAAPQFNPNLPGSYTNPSNPNLNPSMPGALNNPSNPLFNPGMPGATNNPSNPQRNPSMPSSLTNPSNPQMNPAFPGSFTNPSNPINNPDFPTPSEYPPPAGIGPDASTPPSRWSTFSPRQSSQSKVADNWTKDNRQHPDPTEPRASKPPAGKGCTCHDGHKLDCPIHGMNPDDPDYDHSWSLPQAQPVSYPQDAPRTWQQALGKISILSRTA